MSTVIFCILAVVNLVAAFPLSIRADVSAENGANQSVEAEADRRRLTGGEIAGIVIGGLTAIVLLVSQLSAAGCLRSSMQS